MAKLIIYENFDDEETVIEDFELTAQRILIGSGPDNELVLDAPDVHTSHASLELRSDFWVLQDLGGPGGTSANGQTIDGPYHLRHGDLIELGIVKLKFHDEQAAALETRDLPPIEPAPAPTEVAIKGRHWFAAMAGITLVIIFFILLLLIVGDYMGILKISDLWPFWFSG